MQLEHVNVGPSVLNKHTSSAMTEHGRHNACDGLYNRKVSSLRVSMVANDSTGTPPSVFGNRPADSVSHFHRFLSEKKHTWQQYTV